MKIIGIDDVEEKIVKLNKKKVTIAIIGAIILVAVLIISGFYIWNRPFRDFLDKYILMKNLTEDNLTAILLDESENYDVYAYDKYISVFNQNTLTGYNSSGKQEYQLKVEITNPFVDINNRFLLIAEKGGQKVYLISGDTIVWNKELEGNISRISVNKNGYVSVILTGTTYKSIIETFDAAGNQLFKTYLSTSIAMDSDISYDNKYLSFAEISTNGTLMQSMIKTISIQKAKETPSESIISTIKSPSDATVLNLKYHDNNRLICMYDNSIHSIQNGEAKELISLKQEGKKISFADMELINYAFSITEKNVLLSTESTVELIEESFRVLINRAKTSINSRV